jgi:hypothetical protein
MRVACLAALTLLGLAAGTSEASAPSHCTWGKGAAICDEGSTRFIVLSFGVPPLRDSG